MVVGWCGDGGGGGGVVIKAKGPEWEGGTEEGGWSTGFTSSRSQLLLKYVYIDTVNPILSILFYFNPRA